MHIPLIMRLPCTGGIREGTVVSAPVSNLALFGTIVDYLGLPTGTMAPRTSKSLRPLIEGTDATPKLVFSVWMSSNDAGSYMVFDGRFKLVIGSKCQSGPRIATCPPYTEGERVRAHTTTLDALYDLRHDRGEVINLLNSPYVQLVHSCPCRRCTPGRPTTTPCPTRRRAACKRRWLAGCANAGRALRKQSPGGIWSFLTSTKRRCECLGER